MLNFILESKEEISCAFIRMGISDFTAAIQFVYQLPYARNAQPDYRLVLLEKRGTCSTKHALLAQLAREHRKPVDLYMGIYMMNAHNTPGVGEVLAKYHLDAIPEAHCYLQYEGSRYDFTRRIQPEVNPLDMIIDEWKIGPDQIGSYKIDQHQKYLQKWLAKQHEPFDFKELWKIRELCIQALSQ
ncbi:hypothetical protein IC620_01750 [Hazenella sp. IB182357]|uniref:Transglutaminase-like domain-containing protein n=1 Tax=Polycladospora coralii TaxID=2771432 RepID=A0A926N893_9BACL|nr:hypothetical protein [Polycladospora coralii]MBD1371082.1 hypothetical protein [Polycladospora coralii]